MLGFSHRHFCLFVRFQPLALMMSTAVDAETKTALATAANEARGLAMDSIAAAHSGHMGLPLGAAEIGAVLYGSQVRLV
jgi:transketolase